MTVDTSDQSSIRAFARGYCRHAGQCDTYGSLDVLVNNAGVLLADRNTSVDNIELTFATNVLGYYLVTTELLDALKAGPLSRVVNVASTFASPVDLDDLQFDCRPYDGLAVYAQSKACDRMLTWALARRLEGEAVTVNAMAPGLVLGTSLYRNLPPEAKRGLEQYGSRSVSDGAETAVWLASSAELNAPVFRKFRRALKPGGTLVINDFVVNDDRSGPRFPLIFHSMMLLQTKHGATWREADYRAWLDDAGFAEVTFQPTPSPATLVFAR